MQAAQAMSAYSDWAPPQYQEDEQQAQPAASASAGTQQAAAAAGASAASAPEGQAAAENGGATSGFTYDSNSGALPRHAWSKSPTRASLGYRQQCYRHDVWRGVGVRRDCDALGTVLTVHAYVQGTIMIQDPGTTMMPTRDCTLTAVRSNGWRSTLTQGSSALHSLRTLQAQLQRAPLVRRPSLLPWKALK